MDLYRDNRCWAKVPGIRFSIHWPMFLAMLGIIVALSMAVPAQGLILGVAYFGGLVSRYLSGD